MSDKAAEPELIYPPSKSMSGANTTYVRCACTGRHRSYAVCLHTIKAEEEGRLDEEWGNGCQAAITRGSCEALSMRAQEEQAGKALFFVERIKLGVTEARPLARVASAVTRVAKDSYSYLRGRKGANSPEARAHADAAKPAKTELRGKKATVANTDDVIDHSLGSVVTKLSQEHAAKAKPEAVKAKPESIKPITGETPLEFARRRARELASASQ